MSYVSDDKNYTDPSNSGIDTISSRVGDITGEPPTNEATDREKAAKMANLLEDLEFPATKEDIKNHINRKSPAMGNRINDIFEVVWNNLRDDVTYNNAFEIEKAAGLVKKHMRNNEEKYWGYTDDVCVVLHITSHESLN